MHCAVKKAVDACRQQDRSRAGPMQVPASHGWLPACPTPRAFYVANFLARVSTPHGVWCPQRRPWFSDARIGRRSERGNPPASRYSIEKSRLYATPMRFVYAHGRTGRRTEHSFNFNREPSKIPPPYRIHRVYPTGIAYCNLSIMGRSSSTQAPNTRCQTRRVRCSVALPMIQVF